MMMYINLTVMVAVLVRRCQELEGNLSKFRDQANTIRELLRTKVCVHLSSSFSVCELSHVLLLFGIIPKLLKLKILFHNFVPHMYCHTWASTVCCLLFCTPKYSMFFLEQYHVPIKKMQTYGTYCALCLQSVPLRMPSSFMAFSNIKNLKTFTSFELHFS